MPQWNGLKNKIELVKGATTFLFEGTIKVHITYPDLLKTPVKAVKGFLMLNAFRDTCLELKQDFHEEVAAAILQTSSNPEIQTALFHHFKFAKKSSMKRLFNTELSEQIANAITETIPLYEHISQGITSDILMLDL